MRYLEALTGLGKTRAEDKHRYGCYLTEQPSTGHLSVRELGTEARVEETLRT